MNKIKANKFEVTINIDEEKYVVAIKASDTDNKKPKYYICLKSEIESEWLYINLYIPKPDIDIIEIWEVESIKYDNKIELMEDDKIELIIDSIPYLFKVLVPAGTILKSDVVLLEK